MTVRLLLFLTIGFLSPLTWAADTYLPQSEKVWSQFQSCGTHKKGVEKCLEDVLPPKMDSLVRQKMIEYVVMGFKFSNIHECTEQDTVQPMRPAKDLIFYCLHVLGRTSRSPGYATFEKSGSQIFLTSVRYSLTE